MFITFEGPDGSGKTTALNKLTKYLNDANIDFVLTREPGFNQSWASKRIRNIIVSKESDISGMTEAILFAADRRQHLERVIWPAMEQGKLIICDRYFDSSFAYQGKARKLGMDKIISLNETITDNTFPDMTFYFDLPIEESLKRISSRGDMNRLDAEDKEFHQLVHNGYHELIERYKERFHVIDASKSIDLVFEDLLGKFKKLVLNK